MWLRDLLLLGGTAGICVGSLFNPVFGILAYFGYSFFSPQSYMYAFSSTLPHVQAIAIATLVGYIFWREPKYFPKEREFFVLLFLWAWFGFTTIFSIDPESAIGSLFQISKILLMVVLALSLINSNDRLFWLIRVFALSIGIYGIKSGLYILVNGPHSMITGPIASFFYANTALGLALTMNVPLLVFLSKVDPYTWGRWIAKVSLVLTYPAVVGTFSRGAWVGLALVTFLILLKSRHKAKVVAFGVILVIASPVWLPYVLTDEISGRFDTLVNYEEDSSAESRFWNWEFCARVGISNPLTGGGFQFYSPELYAQYFPEFTERWGAGKVWSCHNMWLTIWSEHGILAFLVWLRLFGFALLSLLKLRATEERNVGLTWVVEFSDMATVSLLGFMLMGVFLDVAYYEGFYVLLGLIIIVKNLKRHGPTHPIFDHGSSGQRRGMLESNVRVS